MNTAVTMQVRFNPEDIQFKTMKIMDRAAQLAMMPDYDNNHDARPAEGDGASHG